MAAVAAAFQRALYHVILPPQLPGHQDPNLASVEGILLGHMIDACQEMIGALTEGNPVRHALSQLENILHQTRYAHGDHLERAHVITCLQSVADGSEGVVLYVWEQNAGLIIYWTTSWQVLVSCC